MPADKPTGTQTVDTDLERLIDGMLADGWPALERFLAELNDPAHVAFFVWLVERGDDGRMH